MQKKGSTVKMRFTCATVFVITTYLYLGCFQGDILAVGQHVLSAGKTDYSYALAPVLITVALLLLQLGVYAVARLKRRFHALTYLPSMMLLALVTSVSTHPDTHHSLGAWVWAVPLLLAVWGFAVWVLRQLEPYEPEIHRPRWLSSLLWQNLLQLLVMMMLVQGVANHDRVFHERMKMERLMQQGRYAEALRVGEYSLQADSSLTMLRIACLHKTGTLGERLFCYPLVGGSQAMLPDGVTTKALMWRMPRWMHRATATAHRQGRERRRQLLPADYRLAALLLDKRLDDFAREVTRVYRTDSAAMPRHFREALMLYTHRRAHPLLVYRNSVMEADFQDYQALERKYRDPRERQTALRDSYAGTYWYYYQYGG